MADLDITQMTQLAVAPAADDVVYIGDVSEVVLADQNKHIEIENLFQYLNGGYQSDIVLDTSATLDLTLGAVHLNEAVDLLATSTELNQLDGVSVGGTSAGDIATIDGTQTLTNKALTTPTIGDLTNATHDHSNAAGGGTLNKVVHLTVFGTDDTPATGNGKKGLVIDANLNGLELTEVTAGSDSQGSDATYDVMVRRDRSGTPADMLSTAVTLAITEYYAQDGVINTSNDDVQTGDIISIDIDTIQTGGGNLYVTLEFS